VFAVSLLASGLSSSTVGTMSGQVIMQGFVHWQIPIWLRRLLTMLPALIVIGIGLEPTRTLVLSQVVLSFGLRLPRPHGHLHGARDLMGVLVTATHHVVFGAVTLSLSPLNMFLLYQISGQGWRGTTRTRSPGRFGAGRGGVAGRRGDGKGL
jgi:manganese transport protein